MNATTRIRQVVISLLRLASLVLLIFAAFSLADLLRAVTMMLRSAGNGFEWIYFTDAGGVSAALTLVVQTACGLVLGVFSGRLTAWLVPSIESLCLRCGHRLDPANVGVCPECGTAR